MASLFRDTIEGEEVVVGSLRGN